MNKEKKFTESRIEYLKLLAEQYPSIQQAASEYIRLSAILNLPKPTEHFLSDIHGEHDTFMHFLVSGSGVIRNKIEEALEKESKEKKDFLATIIYYPKEKLDLLAKQKRINAEVLKEILKDLITITRFISSKYTRSKVRSMITIGYQDIVEELLQTDFNY